MSFSHRGRFHTIVTTAVVVFVIGLSLKATWDISALNAQYPHEADNAAKQYADRTQERIASTCTDRDASALAKCVEEIVKATEEAKTAERDLAAQQGMEFWALWMFWATAASVVVTGIGIYFVWRTLDANTDAVAQAKAANDIAREASEAQLRAYLIVKGVYADFIRNPATAEILAVAIKVKILNGGATPAINIGHMISVYENQYDTTKKDIRRAILALDAQQHRVEDLPPGDSMTIFETEIPVSFLQSFKDRSEVNCNLDCSIGYQSVVGEDPNGKLVANYWIRTTSTGQSLNVSRIGHNSIG